ncbi:GMC family oxidoreductase (plasmid) [Lichenicola cladoniae]|uniref:GMC family oxidoreductase n=1 Tax=Lichenicola cladoniae TaxID=1484109 RepID=A0A6M8HY39_9PROT|nr:GMC family oxidoreductase [Lichenicola cladoniae]NPD68969.1 GMC family oxidoreductase [Acetobacteraceae bacterium]QKE93250.1 GMC family oxidoreductase [Lichenicola cladoniae]
MPENHYDIIVIGSGPGGGALAQSLAPTGKRILMLERGGYLPRSRDNWDAKTVFVDGAYQAPDTWYGKDGSSFHPGLHYYVGGNSKVYGSALFRLRERDFGELRHKGGISPAWPLGYNVFEPYYTKAEALFHVHGLRGEDPTEPWSSAPYAYPPVQHEPRIQELSDILSKAGLHPFHLPLGIKLDQNPDGSPTTYSPCIRCDAFDGFPCAVNAKADAQVICIDPTRAAHLNFTLLTGAYVTRLETDASGRSVSRVHVIRDNQFEQYSADIVVVAAGALSSALLLLRSASDAHPNGLANGSDQVGRNYMRHNMSVVMALLKEPNHTVFQKTLALSDYYFDAPDWDYPLGLIQMCATSHGAQIRGEAPLQPLMQLAPRMPFEKVAEYSMDFWLQSEDLPRPENRISYDGDRVVLSITEGNEEAASRLRQKLEAMLVPMRAWPKLIDRRLYLGKDIPINGTAHQAGTLRFGTDPAISVLDLNCKAHQLDNLYVTDASFFPSVGAVNPTLTIIANALRVADVIRDRLAA